MSPYCLRKDGVLEYELFAVDNHYGRMGFGHYTAFARDLENPESVWHNFDDSHVSPITESQVVTKDAYILFYKKKTKF